MNNAYAAANKQVEAYDEQLERLQEGSPEYQQVLTNRNNAIINSVSEGQGEIAKLEEQLENI